MTEVKDPDPFIAIHHIDDGSTVTKDEIKKDKDGSSVWREAELEKRSGVRVRIRTPNLEILKRWRKEHVPLHTRVKDKINRIISEPKMRRIKRISDQSNQGVVEVHHKAAHQTKIKHDLAA